MSSAPDRNHYDGPSVAEPDPAALAGAERLSLALAGGNLGVWDYHARTSRMVWSERLREIVGRPDAPLDGPFEPWLSLVRTEDRTRVRQDLEAAAVHGALHATYGFTQPDGAVVHLEFRGRRAQGGDGSNARIVGVAADVTSRRQGERESRQAQRLTSIGQLAAGIAHELNNPIQIVSDSLHAARDGTVELISLATELTRLLNSVGAGLDPTEAVERGGRMAEEADFRFLAGRLPNTLDRALRGLQRMATIVQSIRRFAEQDGLEMKPVNLNNAIEATLTVVQNEYKYIADLETDLKPLPLVTCQVGDINHVLLSLIINATEAIARRHDATRGTITVRTRDDGPDAVIEVSDTGVGIATEAQPRIFDPFFTTKDAGQGTGQSLAIAHAVIVEKHRGSIRAESTVGVGTTFRVTIPVEGPGGMEG